MITVKWTEPALQDLEMIRDYFQLRSPKHASFIIQKIFEVTKTLETFPKIGRVVPELSIENIREILY